MGAVHSGLFWVAAILIASVTGGIRGLGLGTKRSTLCFFCFSLLYILSALWAEKGPNTQTVLLGCFVLFLFGPYVQTHGGHRTGYLPFVRHQTLKSMGNVARHCPIGIRKDSIFCVEFCYWFADTFWPRKCGSIGFGGCYPLGG